MTLAGAVGAKTLRSSPELGAGTQQPSRPAHPAQANPALRLRFVGDVIFGRYRDGTFSSFMTEHNPFERVRSLLEGDLTVANLETPVVLQLERELGDPRPLRFGADREMVRTLAAAGINVVTLANNHAADQGKAGLWYSPHVLLSVGVLPLGAALPVRAGATRTPKEEPPRFRSAKDAVRVESVSIRGMRVGFVSVTSVMNFTHPAHFPRVPFLHLVDYVETIGPLLEHARADHDVLIVLSHWGKEFDDAPSALQRKVARSLVDAGADLIIGHHPHVLQEIESYRGGLIAYSLGNFLFENLEPKPRLSGVLAVDVLSGGCAKRVTFSPVDLRRGKDGGIYPTPAPEWAAAAARARVLPAARSAGSAGWTRSGSGLERLVLGDRCEPDSRAAREPRDGS